MPKTLIQHYDTIIPVLDKGYVRLVDHMGSDLSVVRSARVSHDADWRAGSSTGSDERLINYLMEHKHVSPFEAVEFQFEVKAPVFIFRQWYRHRPWSPNEVSGRYTEFDDPEFYIPEAANIGVQAKSNKQAREIGGEPGFAQVAARSIIECSGLNALADYRQLIDLGTPRELARIVLPANLYTRCFIKADLRAVFSFLDQRASPHAQWEIQQYAQAIYDLVAPIVPVSMSAWRSTRALH